MLTVGIILLFIGVAIAPSITQCVVTASHEDDRIAVTTQAYGIQGYGTITVKLSKAQYQDLEQYLADFRQRLNQTTTREEAIPILKEAVVKFDTYGLLPKGMNIEDAQRLVIGENHDTKILQLVSRIGKEKSLNFSTNVLCLVAGYSNKTVITTLFQRVTFFNFLLLSNFLKKVMTSFALYLLLDIILIEITMFFFAIDTILPIVLWSDIYLQSGDGFLYSFGLGGIKKQVGTLNGQINGFTGIKILLNLNDPFVFFYLGSGLYVNVGTEPMQSIIR